MRLASKRAVIKTASVDVRVLTLDGKQVTLAVFRQLRQESLHDVDQPVIWGTVNYFFGDCKPGHLHVVWQRGDELLRDCLWPYPKENLTTGHSPIGNVAAVNDWYGRAPTRWVDRQIDYLRACAGSDVAHWAHRVLLGEDQRVPQAYEEPDFYYVAQFETAPNVRSGWWGCTSATDGSFNQWLRWRYSLPDCETWSEFAVKWLEDVEARLSDRQEALGVELKEYQRQWCDLYDRADESPQLFIAI